MSAMDIDSLLRTFEPDGTLNNIQNNEQSDIEMSSIEMKVDITKINDDVKSNLEANESIYDNLNIKLSAQGNQGIIASYLINVLNVQRLAKHNMLLSQNDKRIRIELENRSKLFTDSVSAIGHILHDQDLHAVLPSAVGDICKQKIRIKTEDIALPNPILTKIEKNVDNYVQVNVFCHFHNFIVPQIIYQ